MPEMTYAQAGLAAVTEEMRRDPTIFYMTTDTIAPLVEEFGPMRTRPTPIAESAMTGMAIGAAGSGMRPICDWRQVTFCFVAMDQIVNQAAKIHYMFGGQAKDLRSPSAPPSAGARSSRPSTRRAPIRCS